MVRWNRQSAESPAGAVAVVAVTIVRSPSMAVITPAIFVVWVPAVVTDGAMQGDRVFYRQRGAVLTFEVNATGHRGSRSLGVISNDF